MIINTTSENLHNALAEANKHFGDNLIWNNFQRLSDTRHRVTLRVKDSHGKGARLGFPSYITGRRRPLINACWHAHGEFFDALPKGTKILTAGTTTCAGDTWQDRDIGSLMYPFHMSEACNC